MLLQHLSSNKGGHQNQSNIPGVIPQIYDPQRPNNPPHQYPPQQFPPQQFPPQQFPPQQYPPQQFPQQQYPSQNQSAGNQKYINFVQCNNLLHN